MTPVGKMTVGMMTVRDDDCVDSGLGAAAVGPEQAAQDRITGRRRWILGAIVAQLFLVSAYVAIITSDLSIPAKFISTALLLVFSAMYTFLVGGLLTAPFIRRAAVIGALFALTLPQFIFMGTSASVLWIFVSVAGGMLFEDALAMGLGIFLAGLMLVVDAVAGEPLGWELALTLVALTAFMVGFAGNIRLNIELRATREQLAVAAVAAERERIGRDLHDILGHSLTAIAVKAGLARRLLGRDDAAAATEIGDVERLAREALADVRATASGFREVSLATELAVAGAVLRAAGIRAQFPQAVDEVDPANRELFGFVVREAVTNVVRHSKATTCVVTLGPDFVEIADNGSSGRPALDSAGEQPSRGTGLPGLANRIAARGGSLAAGPRPSGGFAVRANMRPDPETLSIQPAATRALPGEPHGSND